MDISKYIKELIYRYERVVLPGFGAFTTDYLPAFIHKTKNYIAPPNKKVNFNPTQKKDDNILISFVAKEELIDETEAKNMVGEFIGKIENTLKTEGKYFIKGVGLLIRDNGNTFLKQDYKSNLLFESYGMREVSLFEKQKPEDKKEEKELPEAKRRFQRIYDRKKTIKRVLIYTPIAAALVFIFIYLDVNRNYKNDTIGLKDYGSGLYFPSEEAQPEEEEIIEVIDQKTDKREALLYTEPPKPTYYIIAGSFKSIINAGNFKKEMSAKGFSPIILDNDGELYRVALKKFSSKPQAQVELQNLKSQSGLSLWVLTR